MGTNVLYIGDVGRTKEIRHDELKEGMLNWRSGHLLKVTKLTKLPEFNEFKQRIEIMIRFTGVLVDENDELYNTGYNGAHYGAWGWYPAIIKLSMEDRMSNEQVIAKKYIDGNGICCPFCEDWQIEGGPVEINAGTAHQEMSCLGCERQWTDHYKLVNISIKEAEL